MAKRIWAVVGSVVTIIGAIDVPGQLARWSTFLQAHDSLVRWALVVVGIGILVATYRRSRPRPQRLPAALEAGTGVTLQDLTIDGSRVTGGPIIGIGAGGNSTVDAARIGVSGFDRGIDARDSAKVKIRD